MISAWLEETDNERYSQSRVFCRNLKGHSRRTKDPSQYPNKVPRPKGRRTLYPQVASTPFLRGKDVERTNKNKSRERTRHEIDSKGKRGFHMTGSCRQASGICFWAPIFTALICSYSDHSQSSINTKPIQVNMARPTDALLALR